MMLDTGPGGVLDGEQAAILRLIASTGVRIVEVDWRARRVVVELPEVRNA